MLAVQGWLLFFICIFGLSHENWFNIYLLQNTKDSWAHFFAIAFITLETLGVKSIIIPLFLNKVLNKTHAHRDSDANIPHFYALVISSLILFAGFMIANIQTPAL
jgi:hypothetical protein